MPSNLTDVDTFTAPVAVPSSGDSRSAGSVATPFQALANRTRFLHNLVPNGFLRGAHVRSDGASIVVSGLRAITDHFIGEASGNTTVTLAGLSSNTWYYLYFDIDAPDLVLSTTPPSGTALFAGPGSGQLYICAVYALSATTVRPFFHSMGSRVTTWRGSKVASHSLDVLTNGTATSFTDVSLAAFLPPHARMAHVRVEVGCTGGASGSVRLRTNGDTTGYSYQVDLSLEDQVFGERVDIETDSAQLIEYAVVSFGVINYLTPLGFTE